MTKNELRAYVKKLRREFNGKEEASVRICQKLLSLPEIKDAKSIALYCSMEEEVDTDGLFESLQKEGKTVCVPLIHEKKMKFIQISSLKELVSRGSFGIREPLYREENVVSPEQIETAVFPGLAFDKTLNRLGYGGGYYDRTFAGNTKTKRIAVAFSCQLFKNIPSENHDLKMDKIVTEKEILFFPEG